MWILAVLIACVGLSACRRDETLTAYGAANKTWRLVELDGAATSYSANLRFPEPGRMSGQAPCNSFSGRMSAPYPWFEARELVTARLACPHLQEESAYLTALAAMTLSEVLGDTLILSTPEGRQMIFTAAE
ncbi:META domain-containing protein [Roseobacter sinensis]|uniref:META domain-containing protein n=1 Tax=Roseobacter sinensis TaxID=2931391 RepID=A0ABT3BEK4_9RHOB|nr:META domain-containing protein [Roseobacter sp. WL0113]MCV3271574.1 META domain-containing protein [Roseobacter sp. WL0113]